MPSSDSSQHDSTPTTTRLSSYAVSAPQKHLTSARANAPSASGAPLPERKKGRPSKTKTGKQLSKSFSTPQLRGPMMSESDLDKKRNKLGYQRISIACAHCRRRKIRCLLAEDDTEQRCQNCIRLKKECVFYPVDQQAALDARSEAPSRTGEPSAPSPAVSTSPSHLSARSFEQPNHQFGGGYHHMPPEGQGGYSIPIAPTAPLPSQGGYIPQGYGYDPHREPPAAWSSHQQHMSSHNQLTPVSTTSSMPPPFARYEAASNAGDTAPFPGSSGQQSPAVQHPPTGYSYTPEPMPQQWQPPAPQQPVQQPAHRSMSYSNYPNPHPYPQGFNPAQQQPPSFMQQAQQGGPRAMGLPSQTVPSSGNQYSYPMGPEQRSSSIPAMGAYQPPPTQMQQNWYPDGAYGSGGEDGRGHDPRAQGGYPRRPT